jgi:hypothetical protein
MTEFLLYHIHIAVTYADGSQLAGNELLGLAGIVDRLKISAVPRIFRDGMVEPIDTFLTKTERQPATLTANAGEISGMYGNTNTVEYLPPGNETAHAQGKFPQHGMILVLHFLFRPISIQRATRKTPMWAGTTDGVGPIENFDQGLRIIGEHAMDRSHVVDESWTVSPPTESLQA